LFEPSSLHKYSTGMREMKLEYFFSENEDEPLVPNNIFAQTKDGAAAGGSSAGASAASGGAGGGGSGSGGYFGLRGGTASAGAAGERTGLVYTGIGGSNDGSRSQSPLAGGAGARGDYRRGGDLSGNDSDDAEAGLAPLRGAAIRARAASGSSGGSGGSGGSAGHAAEVHKRPVGRR